MALDFLRARPLLQSGNLTKLFVEELGWEPSRNKLTLRAGEMDFPFAAIAEKKGFTAWLCTSADGSLPDHAARLKLERALTQTSFEHLIVFSTANGAKQSWMWVRREPGKPLSARMHEYDRSQPGDSLLQKLQLLYVSLEEEEAGLSVTEIASRARAAFDIEKVTKAFYRDFDTHRKAFLKFIEGIGELADREWYASVMLNRLMFVYFIQRKGFLDGDHDYLRNRLDRCKREQGKDKFYTFYRYFLLRLFHEGFGKRRKDRAPDLEKLLGNIPYLNGGLFDVHELERPERYGKDIQIDDQAFEKVFNYFDQYQWHLDERPLKNDKEINPDVLGYIFEKYINQKQMGAYYTKEDITEYISKNTVIPFLFDAAKAKCKVAFENNDGPTVWDLLRENPDRYIYTAVRHGVDKKLPAEITAGIKDVAKRGGWNKAAATECALPTETWREVVARRQRYEEVRKKLAAGEVRQVNDFITLNLDLRQFAQDVVQNCEGPDLLMAFWSAITSITVLDPTGGSGAFIFAALNILEPLYEACLDRMETFLAEWGAGGQKNYPNYHKKFTEVLARVDAHPNRRYFVLKSVIINNLYAVDIMEEAVEICKLRLFLKLAAQVEPDKTKDNLGIEPLPDIDFNIRAGNTLVGYASKEEVQRCMKELGGGQMKLMGEDELGSFARFNTRCADVEQAFSKFRQLQTEGDGSVPYADKQELQKRLKALEDELNRHLATEYGVKVSDKVAYAKWLKTHQPFHWFVQFYGILAQGGFDVIVGNPPYVEDKNVEGYSVSGYATKESGNLYAYVTERALVLLRQQCRLGVILPLASISLDGTGSFREMLTKSSSPIWHSSFGFRPAKLFEGVNLRLTILVLTKAATTATTLFSSKYVLWSHEERQHLFPKLTFHPSTRAPDGRFLKAADDAAVSIFSKVVAQKSRVSKFAEKRHGYKLSYHRSPLYWIRAMDFEPYFKSDTKERSVHHFRDLHFCDEKHGKLVGALLNSTLFYFWFAAVGNCRNLTNEDVIEMPLGDVAATKIAEAAKLFSVLMKDYEKNSEVTKRYNCEYQTFYPSQSKHILDEIDTVLAEHYGFTPEELDFIINYDIKYRLARDTETEED